jgi:hypothetical protein
MDGHRSAKAEAQKSAYRPAWQNSLISAAKGLQLMGLYSIFRQNPKPELSE